MNKYVLGEGYDFSEVRAEASLPGNYDLKIELLTSAVKERQSSIVFSMTRGGSITSEPLIIDGIVYTACCDHNVYAIDLETGSEIWRFSSQGPNVSGVAYGKDQLYFSSYDGNVYSLNMQGKLLWKFNAGSKITGKPASNDRVYFGDENGNAYAVDSEGNLAWRFRTNGPIGNSARVHGNVVYFSSFDFNIYALTSDGRLLWKYAAGGEAGSPVIGNKIIYFGSIDHCLCALDMQGRLLWRFKSGDAFDPGSGFTIEGDVVYFGSKDFNLYAVRNGKVLWKFPTGNMIFSEPIISGDLLYFGSTDSNLYCINKRTGKEIWRFPAGGPVLYAEKSGSSIVFGCHDCNLYCVSDQGKLLWKFHTSLNYPSDIEPETEIEHTVIIPDMEITREEVRKGEVHEELGSYGDFKGQYIGEDMRDYIGSEVNDGVPGLKYKTGKGVYRK